MLSIYQAELLSKYERSMELNSMLEESHPEVFTSYETIESKGYFTFRTSTLQSAKVNLQLTLKYRTDTGEIYSLKGEPTTC